MQCTCSYVSWYMLQLGHPSQRMLISIWPWVRLYMIMHMLMDMLILKLILTHMLSLMYIHIHYALTCLSPRRGMAALQMLRCMCVSMGM